MPAHDIYHDAVKHALRQDGLADTHPGWELYLAVPQDAFYSIFTEPLGQLMTTRDHLRLLVFDQIAESITQWIP